MAYQEIVATDTLDEGRGKINANALELFSFDQVSITGATSLTSTALGKIHVCTGTSADYTVDLPTAVGNEGTIIIKGAAALTKVVTIQGTGGQTIDGYSDRKIAATGMVAVISDGANWVVVNEVGSWIPFTTVLAGYSADPTIAKSAYFTTGKWCNYHFATLASGTSNATTKTIQLPFNTVTANVIGFTLANINNGVAGTTPGLVISRAGSNIADVYRDLAAAVWTASGGSRFSFNIMFPIA
jgi:hypothetical protein